MPVSEGALSPFARWFPAYPASVVPNLPVPSGLFDKHFGRHGGRYSTDPKDDTELGQEWFKRRFWDYLRKFQTVDLYANALRQVFFNYVNDPSLNASVIESQGFGLVGLCTGCPDNLGGFFQVLLSHPEVMPDVGDPGKQTKWFHDLSGWDWNLSLISALESLRKSGSGPPVLAKGKRAAFAGYLTMFAMDFLFFHEIGHWCNGHDRFAKKTRDEFGPFMSELGPRSLPPIPGQILELEADSFAVNLMTNEWFQAPFGPTGIFRSAGQALCAWATAMAFTFVLFGQEQKIYALRSVGINPHPRSLGSHPHPGVRLENVYTEASRTARMFSRAAVSTLEQAWQEALSTVSRTCGILKIPSSTLFADEDVVEKTFRLLCINKLPMEDDIQACTRLSLSRQ